MFNHRRTVGSTEAWAYIKKKNQVFNDYLVTQEEGHNEGA